MTIRALAELIERTTGLALDRGGVNSALDRFVTERLHVLRLAGVEEYITLAANPAGAEQHRLIDAITVPHTWFYRDPEQLQTISLLMAAAPAGRIAIWVAGCATGEEAYTLAMIGRSIGREVSVLATDVNETALAAARLGVYSALAVRDVPPAERRWLSPQASRFVVDPELRSEVSFMRHNLVEPPPQATARGGWDLVVCRNVLIYFSPLAVTRVLERFARSLREGGSLVVGASEVVFEPPPGLELVSAGNRLVLRRLTRAALASSSVPLPPSSSATHTSPYLTHAGPYLANAPPPLAPPAPAPAPPPPPLAPVTQRAVTATQPQRPMSATSPPTTATPRPMKATSPPVTATSRPVTATSRPVTATNPGKPREPMRSPPNEALVTALTRGHRMFEQGEISASLDVYGELAHNYPAVAEVWLFLGIARFAHGDVNEAANALRASLCLDPTLWPAGFYLARAYDRLGRGADALHQYDLVAVDELQPLALQSTSAVINEIRAYRHDIRKAARRVAAERTAPVRRMLK